jgi:transcriptional regulator with XRE-family HTH domain
MADTTKFSEWITAQLKKKAGWTFGTLAERAKISRAAAYFYRDGLRVPNEEALMKIARALDIERSSMPQFAPKLTK